MNTVIHITHWKAGSTWIRRILRRLAPDRFERPPRGSAPFPEPVRAGAVRSVYATREEYEAADLPPHSRFVVLRDPRDTLVSAYFSFRDTHPPSDLNASLRGRLLELDKESGLIHLMDYFMPRIAAIHESWRGESVIRYEDLLTDDLSILRRVLLDQCGFDVPEAKLERIILENRFRSMTGRARGDEAPEHLRKGVAGDWRNHFTPRVRSEYDSRFGSLEYS